MTQVIDTTKHQVREEHAHKFWDWIHNRGGIAIWPSVNMSNLGMSMSSPALTPEGEPTPKPNWQLANTPSRIITDPSEVEVCTDREVKRFRVALRMGAQGFMVKCTDASTRKIHKAVEKAGNGAYYQFDYSTQEAVIMQPSSVVPLPQWIAENPIDKQPSEDNHECNGSS